MKTLVLVLSMVAAASAIPDGGYGGPGTGGPGSGGQGSGGPGSGGQGSGGPGSSGQGSGGPGYGGPGSGGPGSGGPGSGGPGSGGPGSGGQGGQFPSAPARYGGQGGQYGSARYNFQWDVNDQPSGNFYGHREQRDGDNTQGSYYVQLPDSRRLKVEYFVDQFGYHPTVTFEGDAQYPSGSGPGSGSQPGYYQ